MKSRVAMRSNAAWARNEFGGGQFALPRQLTPLAVKCQASTTSNSNHWCPEQLPDLTDLRSHALALTCTLPASKRLLGAVSEQGILIRSMEHPYNSSARRVFTPSHRVPISVFGFH